ncbi:hypothetical protein O5553_29125 [Escherichia coli]|nr:hypothetical protein [Escherichia coli]
MAFTTILLVISLIVILFWWKTNNRQWRDVQPRILKKSGQCWLREVRSEKRTESKISAEG